MVTTRKTATTAERTTAEARTAKSAAPNTVRRNAAPTLNDALVAEQKRRLVEVAAYYIAERRGFQGGNATADWLTAEAEIDRLIEEEQISA